jgi:hypothetical protein
MSEVHELIPSIFSAFSRISKEYKETTHPKLKMLDCLIVLCILSAIVQFIYAKVVGRDPFNAYLAGLFCSIGQFALSGNPSFLNP